MLPAITAKQCGGGRGGLDPLPLGFNPPTPTHFFLPTPTPFFSFIFLRWYPRPKFRFFAPAHFLSEDPQPPPPRAPVLPVLPQGNSY